LEWLILVPLFDIAILHQMADKDVLNKSEQDNHVNC